VDVVSTQNTQHREPIVAMDSDRNAVVVNNRHRLDEVLPDRRPFIVDSCGQSENKMKRKTLRRCDDGHVSVSESFTESEITEDGIQLATSRCLCGSVIEDNTIMGKAVIPR